MPNKPKRPCASPRCPSLTETKYCEQHRPTDVHKRYDEKRGTAAERGYDTRWRKARLGFLKKHPLCVHCQEKGRLTPSKVVDHIIPHKGNKELFWQRRNWQALCLSCHSTKTAREDGGFGNGK